MRQGETDARGGTVWYIGGYHHPLDDGDGHREKIVIESTERLVERKGNLDVADVVRGETSGSHLTGERDIQRQLGITSDL